MTTHVSDKTSPPPAAPHSPPTLLELAQKFDATPWTDWDARSQIGERMECLDMLGVRRLEFDERYGALVEKHPEYPWPAETVLRGMGMGPNMPLREEHSVVEKGVSWRMQSCVCAFTQTSQRIAHCDRHVKEEAG